MWAQQLHRPKFAIGSRRIGPAERSIGTFSWVRTFSSWYLERSHGTFPRSNGTVKVCPLAYSTDPIWTFRPFRLLRRSLIHQCPNYRDMPPGERQTHTRSFPWWSHFTHPGPNSRFATNMCLFKLFSVSGQVLRADSWDLHGISFIPGSCWYCHGRVWKLFPQHCRPPTQAVAPIRGWHLCGLATWQRHTHFLQHLNQQHPSIKFTMETEEDHKIAFLDVAISRNPDGSLHHNVYRKPQWWGRYGPIGRKGPCGSCRSPDASAAASGYRIWIFGSDNFNAGIDDNKERGR